MMKELSEHILDIVQNSISAKATLICVNIEENIPSDRFTITIRDNGIGMSTELLQLVEDPFTTTRTTRKIGLGIPFFKAAALGCGGSFKLESRQGEGTRITATFLHSHIDRAPLGKMDDTIISIITSPFYFDLVYTHSYNSDSFCFDTREIRKALGGVPLSNIDVVMWIKSYVQEQLNKIYGGVE